jgi:hypothetical protein
VSRPMQLAPKTYEVLVALLRRAGGLVMRQELHAQVWAGSTCRRRHLGGSRVCAAQGARWSGQYAVYRNRFAVGVQIHRAGD